MDNILNEGLRASKRENVRKRYAKQIEQILTKAGFNNSPTRAYSLLDNREALHVNALASSTEYVTKVNALVHEYNELYETCVFCASFPSDDTEVTVKGMKRVLTKDQDRQSRNYQFVNFINKPLKLTENPSKNYWYEKAFYEYEVFLKEIHDFFNEKAGNANEIFIVLLGHGAKQGAILSDETHPIPWDSMLSDIENEAKQRILQDKLVPETVHVVFTQCMAHCGKRQNSIREFVRIESFTGPEKEMTVSTIVVEGGEVRNANHEELNEWGSVWFKRKEIMVRLRENLAELEEKRGELKDILVRIREHLAELEERPNEMKLDEIIILFREKIVMFEEKLAESQEAIARLREHFQQLEEKPAKSKEEIDRLMEDTLEMEKGARVIKGHLVIWKNISTVIEGALILASFAKLIEDICVNVIVLAELAKIAILLGEMSKLLQRVEVNAELEEPQKIDSCFMKAIIYLGEVVKLTKEVSNMEKLARLKEEVAKSQVIVQNLEKVVIISEEVVKTQKQMRELTEKIAKMESDPLYRVGNFFVSGGNRVLGWIRQLV